MLAFKNEETWVSCAHCTFKNHADLKVCEMCLCSLKRGPNNQVEVIDLNPTNCNQNSTFNSTACTEGLIEKISSILKSEGTCFQVCSPCPHITQSGLEGAHWSCGYRNIQMLCHTMIQVEDYKKVLFKGDGDIPDVYGLQTWIEKAWKAGFDTMGADQLGRSLLGTDIWIGATECVALLRYFGIRCRIVQFSNFKPRTAHQVSVSDSNGKSIADFFPKTTKPQSNYAASSVTPHRQLAQSQSHLPDDIVDESSDFDWNEYIKRNTVTLHETPGKFSSNQKSTIYIESDEILTREVAAECSGDVYHDDLGSAHSDDVLGLKDDAVWDSDYSEPSSGKKRNRAIRPAVIGDGRKSARPPARIQQNMAQKLETDLGKYIGNWVRKYFDEKYAKSSNKSMYESICSSSSTPNITMDNIVLPLYFQHEGHSRTIIGYEENINTGNFSLLVFDPFSSGTKLKNNLDKKKATWKTLVKRGLATLTRSAYQVIVVLPGIMSAAERELSKVIDCKEFHV